jgi:hypothetical protein
MLKELIQKLVKDQGARVAFQSGQLQLAGISDVEHRVLIDILKNDRKNESMISNYWNC